MNGNQLEMNAPASLSYNPIKARLYQEDALIEVSERLQIELSKHDLTPVQLQKILSIDDDYYLDGVLECLENITIRDVANIFSVFDKVLSIVPLARGEVARVHSVCEKIQKYTYPSEKHSSSENYLMCRVENNKFHDFAEVAIIPTNIEETSFLMGKKNNRCIQSVTYELVVKTEEATYEIPNI